MVQGIGTLKDRNLLEWPEQWPWAEMCFKYFEDINGKPFKSDNLRNQKHQMLATESTPSNPLEPAVRYHQVLFIKIFDPFFH
jgi:hypothetical protein